MIVYTHRDSEQHEHFLMAWLECAGFVVLDDHVWRLRDVALWNADTFQWYVTPAAPIGHA